MNPNITRYLNKTVFVSIPALFGDGVCRPYKLLGAELNGLWLQSEELTRRLLPDDARDLAALAPAVFVPLAQIAGVLVATAAPAPPPTDSAVAGPNRDAASRAKRKHEKSDERRPNQRAKKR
jgi:hypothetical protein